MWNWIECAEYYCAQHVYETPFNKILFLLVGCRTGNQVHIFLFDFAGSTARLGTNSFGSVTGRELGLVVLRGKGKGLSRELASFTKAGGSSIAAGLYRDLFAHISNQMPADSRFTAKYVTRTKIIIHRIWHAVLGEYYSFLHFLISRFHISPNRPTQLPPIVTKRN